MQAEPPYSQTRPSRSKSIRPQAWLGSAGWGLLLFVVSTLLCHGADRKANPFAPSVTQAEAALLERALAESRHALPSAISIVQEENSETSSAALDFALGNFHYQNGDMSSAELAYVKAARKLPTFRAALNNLARVYLARDKPRRAMSVFQALIRDGQGDAATYRLLGHSLDQLSQPVSAEGAYRHALLLDPGNTEAMRGLARALIHQQRNTEVLSLTQELQQQAPYDEELWSLRANAHLAMGQIDETINAIETAQLLGAVRPALWATLGDLYLNRGQPKDAVTAYTKAFAVDRPNVHHMLQAAHSLLFYDATEEAAELMERVHDMAKDPGLTPEQAQRAEGLKARLFVQRGETDAATQVYLEILKKNPLDGESILALADVYRQAGRRGDTRILLEQASRIEGFEAQALVALAQQAVEQSRFSEAVDLLERAQAFNPQPHIARYLEQVRRITPTDLAVALVLDGPEALQTRQRIEVHVHPDGSLGEQAWAEFVRSGSIPTWADARSDHRVVVRGWS